MTIKTKFLSTSMVSLLISFNAHANQIATNMAQMQAMDKITGRVNIIEVPVGGEVKFGTFSIVVRNCKTNAEGEVPENYAFVDIVDKSFNEEEFNIFKGWMMSSSPAVHAVEHPIYDVWLLKCFDSDVKAENLLSEEQLQKRDELPMLQEIVEQLKHQNNNAFISHETDNIVIKESMYKHDLAKQKSRSNETQNDGLPQNLLNINESFDDADKEDILKENISANIDDELTAAIDAELAKHK